MHMVHVPSSEDEASRHLMRKRGQLQKEVLQHRDRMRKLLATPRLLGCDRQTNVPPPARQRCDALARLSKGIGEVKYSTLVGDFVDYVQQSPAHKLVSCPYDGQTNAKSSWIANESPNPHTAPRKSDSETRTSLIGEIGPCVGSYAFDVRQHPGV
jgi:hypothetical protein